MTEFKPKTQGPIAGFGVNSNTISDAYRDRLVISYSYLGNQDASTAFQFAGISLSTPIMAGPIGGAERVNDAGSLGYAKAVRDAGSALWFHFHDKDAWSDILAEGVPALRVIKPLKDNDRLLEEIAFDTAHGAIGYAMDIDHGYTRYGEVDRQQEVFASKTLEDLKLLNQASSLPFFLKGILSVKDALIAKEAGVAGIVVSGHNNRFPSQIPALKILPEIRKAVGENMMILVDGGINNGCDVFKCLALGADAVLNARGFMAAYAKDGPEGLTYKIQEMTAELRGTMVNTGSPNLSHINRDCISLL